MKGLLLKDYYLIRSTLLFNLIVFIVIAAGMSFLVSTWVLTVLSTIMLGTLSVTTINLDKNSGWRKVSCVLPVSRKTIVDSKYALYLLLSGAGLVLGFVLGGAAALLKNEPDSASMLIFAGISVAMALLSGSISIPCNLLLSEEKSIIILILAILLSAAVFIVASLLTGDRLVTCAVTAVLGVILYAVSWIFARKFIARRDVA